MTEIYFILNIKLLNLLILLNLLNSKIYLLFTQKNLLFSIKFSKIARNESLKINKISTDADSVNVFNFKRHFVKIVYIIRQGTKIGLSSRV